MKNEYPEGLNEKSALGLLLASVERLRADMGGIEATKGRTGLIDKWDTGIPTIHYLERNMRWAREVLER